MTGIVEASREAGATTPRLPATPAPRRRKRLHSTHNGIAWLFVAPFVAVFLLFTAIPALMALGFSFTDMGVGDLRDPFNVNFVGFDNFVRLLSNGEFLRSVLNTAIFVAIGVPLTMAIGFILALVLDAGINRLKTFFRAAIYIPVIANIVAAAVIWQYAFTKDGPVNAALAAIGVIGPNWLGDPPFAVTVVLLLTVWRTIGTCMILFLAGLQSIPEEVYEAAALDGAGYWRRVWLMTLPLLRPTTLLVSVLMSVSFLNIFDEPYLVTNGGPLSSTQSVALWVYDQFGFGNVAESMTGSWILIVLVLLVAVVQTRMLRPKH